MIKSTYIHLTDTSTNGNATFYGDIDFRVECITYAEYVGLVDLVQLAFRAGVDYGIRGAREGLLDELDALRERVSREIRDAKMLSK